LLSPYARCFRQYRLSRPVDGLGGEWRDAVPWGYEVGRANWIIHWRVNRTNQRIPDCPSLVASYLRTDACFACDDLGLPAACETISQDRNQEYTHTHTYTRTHTRTHTHAHTVFRTRRHRILVRPGLLGEPRFWASLDEPHAMGRQDVL